MSLASHILNADVLNFVVKRYSETPLEALCRDTALHNQYWGCHNSKHVPALIDALQELLPEETQSDESGCHNPCIDDEASEASEHSYASSVISLSSCSY